MGPNTPAQVTGAVENKSKYAVISSSVNGLDGAVTRLKELRSYIAGEDNDPTCVSSDYNSLSDALDRLPPDLNEASNQIHSIIEQIEKLLY